MFKHSVPVPRLYKAAAKIARSVKEDGASIKGLVFEKTHPNVKAIYALVVETLQRSAQIDYLLKKSQLLTKEPRLEKWLTRVLLTELIWGKKRLLGDSKPIITLRAYQQTLNAHLTDTHTFSDEAIKVEKPRYVRVNTLKLGLDEAIRMFTDEGWIFTKFLDKTDYDGFLSKVAGMSCDEFIPDLHIENLLVFPNKTTFYNNDAYRNGSIVLQDKASCLPVFILNPEPGSKVLDMCAAPGMKTTQIAAMMGDKGKVFAVEWDLKRANILDNFVRSSGATCIQTIAKDVISLNAHDLPGIEYVLVDPTCSGSGMIDRVDVKINGEPLEQRLRNLSGFQIKILKHALNHFPDVKRVVYSTCSIYPQENEEVVRDVIAGNNRFKLVPAQTRLKGRWKNFASEDPTDAASYCLYARSDEDLTNGFFVAVFERLVEGEENPFFKPRIVNDSNICGNEVDEDENNVMDKKKNKDIFEQNQNTDEKTKSKKRKHTSENNIEDVGLNVVSENPTKLLENQFEDSNEMDTTNKNSTKKKKNKDTSKTSVVQSIKDNQQINPKPPKKKKKVHEEQQFLEHTEINSKSNVKSSKKKNKSTLDVCEDQQFVENDAMTETNVKSSKKKKRNASKTCEEQQFVEGHVNTDGKSSKKFKKSSEICEEEFVETDQINSSTTKSSKNKNAPVVCEEQQFVEDDQINPKINKKTSKKKHKNVSNLCDEQQFAEDHVNIDGKSSKKFKKTSEIREEKFVEIDQTNSSKTKSSKNKNAPVVCEEQQFVEDDQINQKINKKTSKKKHKNVSNLCEEQLMEDNQLNAEHTQLDAKLLKMKKKPKSTDTEMTNLVSEGGEFSKLKKKKKKHDDTIQPEDTEQLLHVVASEESGNQLMKTKRKKNTKLSAEEIESTPKLGKLKKSEENSEEKPAKKTKKRIDAYGFFI